MSLNAVQLHLRSILTGITCSSYTTAPLEAYITPPIPDSMTTPRLYIWGASWTERRQTAPRINVVPSTAGFKMVTYKPALYLFTMDDPNSTGIQSRFPLLITQVLQALRTTIMPVTLVDPTTGVKSQLLAIGETFNVRYDLNRTLKDQRYVYLLAMITAVVKEAQQA